MATLPRVKFIWGGSRVIAGRWFFGLFGFYEREEGGRGRALAISVRGLLLWGLGMLMAGYVAAASMLFWLWQHNPYSLLTYTDALLYPVRQSSIQAKKGQAFIAQGQDLWRQKKPHDAANLLRLGLARYPQDFRARITLAQYYALLNRRALALTVLREGLTDEFPGRPYLQTLFDLAEQAEDFDLIAQTSERYAGKIPADDTRNRRWLFVRQVGALMGAPRPEAVLALATAAGPGDLASEHRVLALLALKRPADALAFIADWRRQPGADLGIVARLEVRAAREAGRLDEMDRALDELRRLAPASPAPLVYGVVQRALAGRDAAASAAFDDYIFRFGSTTANLQLLAEPLAEIGQLALLRRCAAAAAERGFPAAPFTVFLVQLHLQRGEWAEARGLLQRMPPPPAGARDAAAGQAWRDWAQRLVEAAATPADAAQLALTEFLRSRPWPIRIFKKTIETLRLAGRWETARDIAKLGTAAFPASASLRQHAAEIAETIAAKERATPVVEASAVRSWGEKPFFTQLEARMQEAKWEEAAALVQEVRDQRPAPGWVASRDADLRLAQARIGHGRGSSAEMLTAAKLFLNGDADRSRRILDLAEEIYRSGDKESAIALAREVQRRSPDYPPVRRLLSEWQPRPAKQ